MTQSEKRRKFEDQIMLAILIAHNDMFLLNDPSEIRRVALAPVDRTVETVNKAKRIYHSARNATSMLLNLG